MSKVFLFTGLSGAGKTTLSQTVYEHLKSRIPCVVLDGDILRKGLCKDLGFTPEDREENIRRCGELAKLLSDQGLVVFLAVIAPYEHLRKNLEAIIGPENLRIIHVDCPVEVCVSRDPKHNYRKALSGVMKNYTGIGDIYEKPENAHLVLCTNTTSKEACIKNLTEFISSQLD